MNKSEDSKIDVVWLGLSNKKVKKGEEFFPLNKDTNSGKVVCEIEKFLPKLNFYRTNLVKFAPVDDKDKLRYPTILEMEKDFILFEDEMNKLKPKIVFLLGHKVSEFVLKKNNLKLIKTKKDWKIFENVEFNGVYFISIFHPSYVYVYKRKDIGKYINTVKKIIKECHCTDDYHKNVEEKEVEDCC